MRRIIVGISGASGSIYRIRLLEVPPRGRGCANAPLPQTGCAPHADARDGLHRRRCRSPGRPDLQGGDVAAAISSGSFHADAMVVELCSIRRYPGSRPADNLLVRAADVILKEQRPLVVLVRKTPLHLDHLRLLVQVAESGAVGDAADAGLLSPPSRRAGGHRSGPSTVPRPDRRRARHDLSPRWQGRPATCTGPDPAP